MSDPKRPSPPAANRRASRSLTGDMADSTAPALDNPAAIAAGWAVLVVRRDDRINRRVYLSLHAAVRARDRAEAAGRRSELVLVELVPVTSMGGVS